MSCEVSRLCEIEFLDAINNERQALARRKNQTNDQNRAQSGSSGVRSGSNSSIHSSVGRFSWLYEELIDRMGEKNDKEFVNKIVADLNQKWTCEEKHRQQSLNLIIKEMKKQTYSGKLSDFFPFQLARLEGTRWYNSNRLSYQCVPQVDESKEGVLRTKTLQ